jgi:diguanylate cyclase (GGDEF)-like protein/PAS domain S-box-containing protein
MGNGPFVRLSDTLLTRWRRFGAFRRSRAERQTAAQLRKQGLRFDTALSNMTQGLVMFDAHERVVLCNRRYLELSGLTAEFMQPGRSLRDLLVLRQTQGSFSRDVDEYRRDLHESLAKGDTKRILVETDDGHVHEVVNVPMGDGGWVATHEDITERVTAKRVIETQKVQLDSALSNMSQGLCMFDANRRLIICNKKYAEYYGLADAYTKPGTPLHTILANQTNMGSAAERNEQYVHERERKIVANTPHVITNHLNDGRIISVKHQPMADGGWVATHDDVTEARRREDSFRLLFEGNPVPMVVTDRASLRFVAVNHAAVSHYGYSREQFMAMTLPEMLASADQDRIARFVHSLPENELVETFSQHVKADGTDIEVCVYSRALTYEGRRARLAAIHDITKAKLVEGELRQTKKFLDAVIEHVPMPIVVKDVSGVAVDGRTGRFTLFNRAYEELTGDRRADLVGKTAHDIYTKNRADRIVEADNEALRGDHSINSEHLIETTHGKRLVTAKKTVIREDDGGAQYLLTVLEDVTERRRAEQRIFHLAHNDSLTGLPNRASFIEHLDLAIKEASQAGSQFAVICIDLDRFKEANDIYGHQIGDGLLREAARRLQAAAADAFIARIGGDEFTLIASQGRQPEAAVALGEQLIEAFREEFEIDGHRMQVGMSAGVAIYPDDGDEARTLLANADAALYQAKAEMRGSVRLFEVELGTRLRERRDLQNDLRAAIASGDITLHYQPQQKINSGETIAFEALARWHSPRRGTVPPGVFIPIAEETGLIIPLGERILREACREAASWPKPYKVAVNISPVQFYRGDLPRLVHSILMETGLSPGRLELEITEGVLIDDFSRAVSILHRLKALGVQIAMDDFGSGYSSLSYLHAFPFDKIKIDRTFIGDLEHNHHSMAIVRAIISLGHSLSVPILAEGVETEAQRAFLRQEGCDEVQGYLTGRPQPIELYARLLGRKTAKRSSAAAG